MEPSESNMGRPVRRTKNSIEHVRSVPRRLSRRSRATAAALPLWLYNGLATADRGNIRRIKDELARGIPVTQSFDPEVVDEDRDAALVWAEAPFARKIG